MSGSTSWTIWWDMHRHPSEDAWSRAMEKTEEEAVQRVQRFLKLGFVVHEIKAPDGSVFMDEAQITGRFGKGSADTDQSAVGLAAEETLIANGRGPIRLR